MWAVPSLGEATQKLDIFNSAQPFNKELIIPMTISPSVFPFPEIVAAVIPNTFLIKF